MNMKGLDYSDETGRKTSVELPAPGVELTDARKSYLGELSVKPEQWSEMPSAQWRETVCGLRDRLEEMGITDVLEQDKAIRDTCSPEVLSEFRREVSEEEMDRLENLENATPLTLDELKTECPELHGQVLRMDERLGNNHPEGIMNTMEYARLENGDYVAYSTNPMYSNSRMVYSGGVVYAKSGGSLCGDNNLNEFINTPKLMPNTVYWVDGRSLYETDSRGRVERVSTVYTADYDVKNERATDNQRMIREGKDGLGVDESSHSVQKSLGGPNEAINQMPVRSDINHGEGSEWAARERRLAEAVDDGQAALVELRFRYEGDTGRPHSVESDAVIGGERQDTLVLDNRLEE